MSYLRQYLLLGKRFFHKYDCIFYATQLYAACISTRCAKSMVWNSAHIKTLCNMKKKSKQKYKKATKVS